MRMNKLIWPDKWISVKARITFVAATFILWVFISYLKYFVFHVDGVLQIVSFYAWLITWTYLFDKDIPTAPVNMKFDDEDEAGQIIRTLFSLMALVVFFLVQFFGDW